MTTSDPSNNRLATVGGCQVTYDAAGNLLKDGTGTGSHTYTWDAEGRMLTATVNGGTLTATYDALGQMVQFSNPAGGGAIPWDMSGHEQGLYTFAENGWTDFYVYLGGRQVAWMAQKNEYFTHFLHANALGSTSAVSDQAGNVVSVSKPAMKWGRLLP